MKRIIAMILTAAVSALMLTACAGPGDIDVAAEDGAEKLDITALPSKFDLRNADGKNYVTPVKCQNWGDCWSFALAGAAEISYLYSGEMGVPAGEKNDQVNFSEKYIAWYMFHGMTKDDVIKGKVRASQVGEGFDPAEAEKERDLSAYFIGGPFVQSADLFGSGFGPVDESVSVNGEQPYAYNAESSVEWQLPLNAEYRCAPVSALFKDSRLLPPPAKTDEDGSYVFNREGIDAIKAELFMGHGVIVALNAAHPGFNNKKRAVYYSGDEEPNHAVVVVGYDDDYPKENFTRKNAKGNTVENSTPPENGAIIIKNSWGLNSNDGDIDDGYFYVSYYDTSLLSSLSFVFENAQKAAHAERNYDQYDLMMTQWYGVTEYDNETKTANIFDAEENESLYQIEYRTAFPDAEVTYEIYRDVESDDPSSGTLLEKGVRSHLYAGSHVINLDREHSLKKGDTYSVVLTVKRGEKYAEVFPYSTRFFEGMTVNGIINKGESFLYTNGKWSDMAEQKDILLERAYDQLCAENSALNKAVPTLDPDKNTFAVDNYPIKAILSAE